MDGEHSFTATGSTRHETFLEVVGWIEKDWTLVTTETNLRGFRKTRTILTGTDAELDDSHTEEEAIYLRSERSCSEVTPRIKNLIDLIWIEIKSLVNL